MLRTIEDDLALELLEFELDEDKMVCTRVDVSKDGTTASSRFKTTGDVRPVLDDDDESFERWRRKHQKIKIAPALARRDA